ncbi:pyridoxal phosphate-dependent aminotransferase [Streptomyces sp. NPDC020731]|uniref:pyridoxal phosphate-dependent aminotransferase n=1 Tax=Streptomyces sp. NPDC020731 TaxID=3365085 RepID=UPI00379D246F
MAGAATDLTGPQRPWPQRLVGRFAAAQEAAVHSRGAWGPPAPGGDRRLLDRLCGDLGAPEDRTSVTAGVRAFAGGWAGETRGVLVERPGFAPLPGLLGVAGTRVRQLPWHELAEEARGLEEPVTLWVTSPGRNPDGRTLAPADADELSRFAGRGHHVMVNRVYRWFSGPGPDVPGGWSVHSLSKLAGGGARLGWVVGPEGAAHPPGVRLTGPATVWQRAWAEFLTPRNLDALVRECAEPTVEARQVFVASVRSALGWYEQDDVGGVAVLLGLRGLDEDAALALFAEHGVRVSPGSAFGAPGPAVRLAFSGVTARQAADAAALVARLVNAPATRGCLAPFRP